MWIILFVLCCIFSKFHESPDGDRYNFKIIAPINLKFVSKSDSYVIRHFMNEILFPIFNCKDAKVVTIHF